MKPTQLLLLALLILLLLPTIFMGVATVAAASVVIAFEFHVCFQWRSKDSVRKSMEIKGFLKKTNANGRIT